jgi:nitroreductase
MAGSAGGSTLPGVDAWLVIASRREVRDYVERPIPDEIRARILDAGRLAGSASNRQPWHFFVLEDADLRERVAQGVYEPGNIRGAQLVVVIALSGKGPVSFDAGRAAQNMMLAAWSEGVGSCPNGVVDRARMTELLGLDEGEQPAIILTFGYPARPRSPEERSPEEWSRRARRKPLDELVHVR